MEHPGRDLFFERERHPPLSDPDARVPNLELNPEAMTCPGLITVFHDHSNEPHYLSPTGSFELIGFAMKRTSEGNYQLDSEQRLSLALKFLWTN